MQSESAKRETLLLSLHNGAPVLLRPVMPDDRERIQEGFKKLSGNSRYLRFFIPIAALSEEELHYLTEVDQRNHVAWIAVDPSLPGEPGMGIGRFIRMETGSAMAEVAITVVDEFQHLGLGSLILGILYLRAVEEGIGTLRAYILPDNHTMINWFYELGAKGAFSDGSYQLDLAVDAGGKGLPHTTGGTAFRHVLKEIRAKRLDHL